MNAASNPLTAILYATIVLVGLAMIWISLCYLYRYIVATYNYVHTMAMHNLFNINCIKGIHGRTVSCTFGTWFRSPMIVCILDVHVHVGACSPQYACCI